MATMQPYEIIQHSDEVKDSGLDWKKVYALLYSSVESNQYRIMRAGNTLFLYKILGDHKAQMYVFNADSAKNYIENLKEFFKAMKVAGFTQIVAEVDDEKNIHLLKKATQHIQVTPVGTNEEGKTIYRGVINGMA
jgi:hypothetical protein